jgi:hypothetical protein
MADFSAQWFGPVITHWIDPADLPTRPSRINPAPGRELRRRTSTVGEPVILRATVDGVTAPLDSALDGRLFMGWFAESPAPPPVVTATAAKSSERTFTPTLAGHYTYVLHRAGGGGIVLHLDVTE